MLDDRDAWRDDRALASRVAGGDEEAFASLIDALHRPLLRVAEAYLGRGAGAHDLLQETWEAVALHIDGYEGRSSLRTWITRILVNRATTKRARETRFVPMGDDEPEQGSFSSAGLWSGTPAFASGPEEALLRRETSGWLVAALDALPEAQRAVVTLRDIEEWSSEEVCNALGLSESNQRVLLHRGRQRLRQALEARLRK